MCQDAPGQTFLDGLRSIRSADDVLSWGVYGSFLRCLLIHHIPAAINAMFAARTKNSSSVSVMFSFLHKKYLLLIEKGSVNTSHPQARSVPHQE